MWYKRFCSQTFEKQLKEMYKYVTKDLNSGIGWRTIELNMWIAVRDESSLEKYQKSRSLKDNNSIKRITVGKYTIFYQVDYTKKEIYLLYLLYRKN